MVRGPSQRLLADVRLAIHTPKDTPCCVEGLMHRRHKHGVSVTQTAALGLSLLALTPDSVD